MPQKDPRDPSDTLGIDSFETLGRELARKWKG